MIAALALVGALALTPTATTAYVAPTPGACTTTITSAVQRGATGTLLTERIACGHHVRVVYRWVTAR